MGELAELMEAFARACSATERVDVVAKIGTLGTREAVKALVQILAGEQDEMVREAVICSLLICNSEDVAGEVISLLRSEDPLQRSIASEVLTYKIDSRNIELFRELFKDSDRDVRVAAVHILGRSAYPGSLSLLREVAALDPDINVVGAAIEYIGELGSAEDAELLQDCGKRFNHPYLDFVIKRALSCLGVEPDKAVS